jgi:hypothetical protein
MKNFRITIDGKAQFVAADQCDCTAKKVVFYSGRSIVKIIDAALVKTGEELDDRLRPSKVIFRNHTPVTSNTRKACEGGLK